MYRTVGAYGRDEIIINKSRFIGTCKHVETPEEALAFLAAMREEFKDASHNCYAYVLGENAGIMRYSDDGEPGGTAGMPIIEVIRQKNVVNCAVVVTRYFGGVLLGAGGLVRAYTKGCAIALEAAGIVTMRECIEGMLCLPYSLLAKFEHEVKDIPLAVLEKEYADSVTLSLRMPVESEEAFLKVATTLTAGEPDWLETARTHFAWRERE